MKKYLIAAVMMAFIFAACDSGEKPAEAIPEGYHQVEVLEHMDAQNYTYMRVSENDEEYWIAVPQMPVQDGDVLYFSRSMEMKKFNSKSLNRTFESVLFVEDISREIPQAPTVVEHPKVNSSQKANVTVEPLSDGMTIEQIYAKKDELAGKTVRVRGMVTKYNPEIMSMNWLHIQDGTGSSNDFDLAVTTKDQAENGRLVIVEGTVALNRDFGSGYAYDVIIENAKITVE